MRIAYFTDLDLSVPSGVLSKHIMQCEAWKKEGHEVKIFCIPSAERVKPVDLFIEHEIFDHRLSNLLKGGFAALSRKILVSATLLKALKTFNTDILYIRSTTWYPGLQKIAGSFPSIIEFNTNIEDEIRLTFTKRMQRLHNFGKDSFYHSVNGMIGVTEEITRHYAEIYAKKSITIANGFDLTGISECVTANKNDRPQIVFVGSPGYSWHGVDKFLELAKAISTADFHLVGPVIKNAHIPFNLIQHGYLAKTQLFDLYLRMNIGVGSLALHRKNLNEASPLKVREYCAFGLPLILAYKDTDLSDQDFVLQIDNCENTIKKNLNSISAFIDSWKDKRISRSKVYPLIDYSFKEKKRLEFMQLIADISLKENNH